VAQERHRVFPPVTQQSREIAGSWKEQVHEHAIHAFACDYNKRELAEFHAPRRTYNRLTPALLEVIVRFKPLALMVLMCLLTAALPLVSLREPAQQPGSPLSQPPTPEDKARAKLEKDMAKKRNQERQAELKRDTDKLFQLSAELKHYVDKSNENTLSLDVVKKAEEIEKLAHSVKEKMKGNN